MSPSEQVALARAIAEGNERYTLEEIREIVREVEKCGIRWMRYGR